MKNNMTYFKKELTAAISLIILVVFVLNPYHFWMPDMVHITLLALTIAVFGVFASFVFKEHLGDERENTHRMLAGRSAFLAGSAVLILGIVIQGVRDAVDPWLVVTLTVMVLVKVLALLYSAKNL